MSDGLISITSATISHLTRPSVTDIFGTPKTLYEHDKFSWTFSTSIYKKKEYMSLRPAEKTRV
jgi:hypothetical protein